MGERGEGSRRDRREEGISEETDGRIRMNAITEA
jgi:hypothetical protein